MCEQTPSVPLTALPLRRCCSVQEAEMSHRATPQAAIKARRVSAGKKRGNILDSEVLLQRVSSTGTAQRANTGKGGFCRMHCGTDKITLLFSLLALLCSLKMCVIWISCSFRFIHLKMINNLTFHPWLTLKDEYNWFNCIWGKQWSC